MAKLTRRQLLLASLTAGAAGVLGHKQLQIQSEQERQATLQALARAKDSQKDAYKFISNWFGAGDEKLADGLKLKEAVELSTPTIPYDREMSKLLVQCSRICTFQYIMSKFHPDYDGSIKVLPGYSSQFHEYQQIASIRGSDDEIEEDIEVEVPTTSQSKPTGEIEKNLNQTEQKVDQVAKQIVKLKKQIPVYIAFVLTSKNHSIIAFRGTNRTAEMIQDLLLFQQDYSKPGYGKVHSGFADVYDSIAQQVRDVAAKLNPAIPCYVTGHSLGAALATLATLDLSLQIPALKPKLQLYTYASPRVGDPVFATQHTQLILNSYRVINLADMVTLGPPRNFQGMTFAHIGQVWSFLANGGDIDPNHSFNTYRLAVLREVEKNQTRSYPISGLT